MIEALPPRTSALHAKFPPPAWGSVVKWERGGIMRAVLHYKGELEPKDRNPNMHAIREKFHPQLKRFWQIEDGLRDIAEQVYLFWRSEDGSSMELGHVSIQEDGTWLSVFKDPVTARLSELGRFFTQEDAGMVVAGEFGFIPHLDYLRPPFLATRWPDGTLKSTPGIYGALNQTVFREHHEWKTGLSRMAEKYTVKQFQFVPIVTRALHLTCYLEITLLKPDGPGIFVKKSGDLDSRLKSLLDSLRVPSADQLKGPSGDYKPNRLQKPFYCLLEDDELVSGLTIKTEQWLEPPRRNHTEKTVHANITAIIRPTKVTDANRNFLGGWL